MTDNNPSYHVLVVDDEEVLLDLCKIFLERSGSFQVDTVISAADAIQEMSQTSYDAIVSDYEMPQMNGVEFLKVVRGSGNTVPFIIFTGRGREEVVIEALNSGADFYLQKGGDPKAQFAELSSKLNHAIRQKKAETTLEDEREQLLSIFDSMEQMIYVSDVDTYEILYVNKYLKNVLQKEVVGKTCYEEFYNLSLPCDFCTNKIILKQKPETYSWEHYNAFLDRYYSLVDRIIRWPDGREVRLEVATDVTDAKKAMYELHAAYEEIASSEDELKHNFNELIKNEELLKESEERYRSVVENIQDVFYRTDTAGDLIMISPSALPLFGYDSLDEMIGKNVAEYFYLNSQERDKFLEALKKRGSVYNYETTLKRKDGSPVHVSTNSHYYYLKDGTLAGVEGNFRDISDLKRTTKALRESEQLYRVLVEHTQDGVFIIQGENLVFCNEAFASIAGYKRDEVIKRPFSDLVAPEDRDEVLFRHRSRLLGEQVPDTYEFRMLHRDKVTRILIQMSVGMGDYKGQPASIGTVRNVIREYEQIEKTVRDSRAMLNSILQESPIPQFVIDTNHRVMYWNHALEKYSRIAANDVVGTSLHWRAFYPEERPCLADLILDGRTEDIAVWYQGRYEKSRLIEDAYAATGFFPNIGPAGTWLFFTSALLKNADGEVWGALETLEDISDQKMNEESLIQANKKLNLLSDITRHDILNSLTVLSGSMDLIREEARDPEVAGYIGAAERSLDTIHRQITFTRDYQNLGVTAPKWQSLKNIVKAELLHHIPDTIQFTCHKLDYSVFADAMFGRVFTNLIDNSIRHGVHVTEINLAISVGKDATIMYSDNGIGIVDEKKKVIFERGIGSHTGYGLFLAREILSITNISIIEDGIPGEGARFKIVIPFGFFRSTSE